MNSVGPGGREEAGGAWRARRPFSYVLPLAAAEAMTAPEFAAYLQWVAGEGELIVVDGSPADVFALHEAAWGHVARHVAPDERTLVGKVGNVMTGIRLAAHDRVVVADDDVRFGLELHDLVARLDDADVVRPQNFFQPLPWHAAWDSARSLLNRVSGGDWPGTLAVRRSLLLAAGGYAGDVMFENYELVQTVEAAGGRSAVASDLFVRRLPPSARHFSSQRVRQAYDELARPGRLVLFLAVLPVSACLAAFRRWAELSTGAVLAAAALVLAAEAGRRRDGARAHFPLRCSLAAPRWVAERSVCGWAALVARARGGVSYRGARVRRAALGRNERARRVLLARASTTTPPSARQGVAGNVGAVR